MNYAAAHAYLGALGESRMNLGLEHTRRALAAIGAPARPFPSIIVAGTNGKGSTAGFVQAILTAGGRRAGLFTSPHLESPRERIRIGADPIDEGAFAAAAAFVRARCESADLAPTYFEFLTLLAVHHFRVARVEAAVFEVGLGGRLDATNAFAHDAAVLTRVGLDHTAILGATIERIAAEKAAVFQPGKPAISVRQDRAAANVARAHANDIACALSVEGEDYRAGWRDGKFWYADDRLALDGVTLGLRGDHQAQNAAAAIRAVTLFVPDLTREAITEGLARTRVPGRLERWSRADGASVWLDVGHNPDAARALATHFAGRRFTVLVGMLADKDWRTVLDVLAPLMGTLILTKPDSPRAWDPREAAKHAQTAQTEPDIDRALARALAGKEEIVCLGSFYLVGRIRRQLPNLRFQLTP